MALLRTPRLPLPGLGLAIAPLRLAAAGTRMALGASGTLAALAVEAVGGPPARRYSANSDRLWVEVRGLGGDNGSAVGREVLKAVKATAGVKSAVLNRSVARLVVTVDADGPAAEALCGVVADAERAARAVKQPALNLPGDDALLVARTAGAAVAAAGLGLSVAGSVLRLRGLPEAFSAIPTLSDHVPRLRRQIEQGLGSDGADLLFAVVNSTAAALTVSPVSAAFETANRTMLAAEAWNGRMSWRRHEPELAEHAASDHETDFNRSPSEGPADRYADRAGLAGLGAAAVLGALTGSVGTAASAAVVTVPKPVRATREAFACALGRGLANRHDVLIMRPRALRILDRVDTVVVDPRALYTDDLMVGRVRGLTNSHRAKAWEAARTALADGKLGPGWHRLADIPGANGKGDALVSPVRDPFAAAVLAEARRTRPTLVSVRDDGLRSLAQGFDRLHPLGDSLNDSLADAVAAAKADGKTVLLLTVPDMAIPQAADVTIGLRRDDQPPPWGADLFVNDLLAVWRILHALPAARDASAKGVQLSMSSTALGSLMLIPSVVGSGPIPVHAGAVAGLLSGYGSGNRVFGDPVPSPEPGHDWHALPVDEVRRLLPEQPREADEPSRSVFDAVPAARSVLDAVGGSFGYARDFVGEIRANLADPLTPILATGAIASAMLGSPFDAALVGSVLLGNAALSAEQQLHAERVLRRLLAVQEPPARRLLAVQEPPARRRAGAADANLVEELPARKLRPGDVIEVRSGEVVPADARLIDVDSVEVDESSLTGESLPVVKTADATPGAPLAERACMIYGGSTLVAGTAVGVVTAVGASSEMRRAMAMAPAKSREIGLQSQLRRITSRALPWTLGGGAVVGVLSFLRRTPLRDSVASAVGVIVAAVPEGLPLVATLAQLAAARKLSGESVLIRNPHAVEALARVRVVCFDKTGTLSQNRLQVKALRALDGFDSDEVLRTAADTVVVKNGQRPDHATDEAILRAAEHSGARTTAQPDAVLPFQSDRPFAAALFGNRLQIKGAPEKITAALGEVNGQLAEALDELAAEGLRVLAVAECRLTDEDAKAAAADPERLETLCTANLRPVGVVGLADTLRPAAGDLLKELDNRGIGVRLITGDHPVTASVVAGDLGLHVRSDDVVTGDEWETMSADERADAVRTHAVFARMTPEHKVDVVQTLERIDMVTAMVGDGANDAAAIRAASVGIGVASEGSDPARTAADVMLLDGRIDALIDAIDEGNQLWRRVQSAVSVLLGGNTGEVCFALISSLLTGNSVLNARQMLLVNMLTDALPAAALAVSPQSATGRADRDESVMWRAIAVRGAATTGGATAAWLMARVTGSRRRAATAALIGLVSTQILQTLIDSHGPLVVATNVGTFAVMIGIVSTPGVSQLFGCTPVGPIAWSQAFGAAVAATMISALASRVLAARIGTTASGEESVVFDDDDAGAHQNGVDVTERRGEDTDRATEQRVLPKSAEKVPHDFAR
ncbi:cation-translocating P-type ATPase [Mycobacterium deserti]|uniref:Cation-translocating P-type ATPase n=1 Tax=Mycobacterium deserti TaxID=2978347 RepID=A0ABT2MF10_9MYCO|nr:cation-translocating P-type ATPase [Mycobacterium deserti]MCT7660852.1 cation-translocating P-type ATPase [Mycobacterium deserti]